jgi:hypothetical protein
VIAILSALLAAGGLIAPLQDQRPQLEAAVDEDRLSVGEELVYTLRAVSHSPVPLHVSVAPLNGLEIVSRSERSEVSLGGTPTRTTLLEIRLRAVRPGRWQVGPARAVQGSDTVEAAALVIDVAANRAATATTINPRLRRLLERATPPRSGQAAIVLLTSADSARVGEQVDVVTAAWFPRDLRLQLRRPPTLQPPVIDGVWSYPQGTPAGIAATRSLGGRWYDLFVAHQVVFPLLPGRVAIPPATLKYSTPLALQFFSQEERFALTSSPATLGVRALPADGRPAGFAGAIGSGLRLERRISPPTVHAGDAISVDFALSGQGNTALWPSPEVRWPPRVRAYVERVDEAVSNTDGLVGGTKTFRYLVVSDSAGPLALPPVTYPYFDLAASRYLTLEVSPATLAVTPGGESGTAAALPPALLAPGEPALSWRLAHGVPGWLWVLLMVAPPLVVLGRGRLPVRIGRRRPPAPVSDLRSAEEELEVLLRVLVPDPDRRAGAALAAAVRAAGADADLASRVAAARERLMARRYGPDASRPEDPALAREVHQLVRRLGGSLRGWAVGGAALVLLVAGFMSRAVWAQSPGAEQLYESGSLHAAASGFAQRAAAEPAVAAHWYDLGATYYRMGLSGRAEAAWLAARRLDPREPVLRRALRLTPAPDPVSARWTWSPPVTAEELLLLGTIGWLTGWLGWVARPRVRERWLALLVFSGCAAGAGLGLQAWYRRPLAIVLDRTTLRVSPPGRAPAIVPLETGSAAMILRRMPGWVMIEAASGSEGWVPDEALAAIGS